MAFGRRNGFFPGRFAIGAWMNGPWSGNPLCWWSPFGRPYQLLGVSRQFIGVAVRRVGWKIKQPQPAIQAFDKCFCLLRNMGGASIDDQENRAFGAGDKALEKFNEDSGIDAALLLDHEPHLASRGDRRDEAHAMACAGGFDDRRFALLAPTTPRVMIRAHVGGVAKEDLRSFPVRKGFDPRVFFVEPLLDQGLVSLLRAVQRLLASDAELRQQSTNRIGAQRDAKFVPDQLGDHVARPQRERKFQLQWILLRNCRVNPLHGARIQSGRSSKQRFGLQRSPSTSPILRQPSVYRPAADP